jgi:uncharacterized membrane protein
MKKVFLLSLAFLFLVSGTVAIAEINDSTEIEPVGQVIFDTQTMLKAQVLQIVNEELRNVPGTNISHTNQTIRVEILEGPEKDKEIVVENDYLNLKEGEKFYLKHTVSVFDNMDYYSVDEPFRLPQVFTLLAIFLAVIVIFGGIQGVRGIISLVGSLILITYVLLPGILSGVSPLLVTLLVSSLIIILGSYITHGINKTTTAAVIGMITTVSFTGLLAYWSVYFTRLSGFSSDEVIYLNFDSGGIDVVGLLLGGIMIGLLGVLYDAAIAQAVAVEELHRIAPHLPKKIIYRSAIRMGREHIGALVDTLAIAYVGVSLPLLLLFVQSSTESVWVSVNREIFSVEIVRTVIGSIGLILAVPITTVISVYMLVKEEKTSDQDLIQREKHELEHMKHSHSHHH